MSVMDVVKFSPQVTDWIVFKSPLKDFNTKSRLVVGPGQIAICVYGGKIEREFESGTYTLDSANLPFVKGLTKKIFGGESPYQMEIYFFNKTVKLDWLWGIKNGIQIKDPKFNVIIVIQAFGQLGLRLVNKQFFLTQIYGAFETNLVQYSKTQDFFRGTINTKIKPIIMTYIAKNNVSALDLPLVYEEVANEAKEKLKDEFSQFGFELINLSIQSLEPRPQDLVKVNEILHKRAEFDIIGNENYRTARSFDVLESAASNESQGGVAGIGVGLGVGLGAGQAAGQLFGNLNSASPNGGAREVVKIVCPGCGAHIAEDSKFCSECGQKIVSICPKCKSEIKSGSKFCSSCGEKL